MRRILVPLDGSRRAEQSLELAADLAGRLGGEILLLRVEELPSHLSPEEWDLEQNELLDAQRRACQEYLARLGAELRGRGLAAHGSLAPLGRTGHRILEAAEQEQADLIVVTPAVHEGLRHFLDGSVSRFLVEHAPCPVLVCPPPAAQ